MSQILLIGSPVLNALLTIGKTVMSPTQLVYYDGACPKCICDRKTYENLSGSSEEQVCWFDITGKDSQLRDVGIDPQKVLSELYVRDTSGRIVSELDAYILLMNKVPLLKTPRLADWDTADSIGFSKSLSLVSQSSIKKKRIALIVRWLPCNYPFDERGEMAVKHVQGEFYDI